QPAFGAKGDELELTAGRQVLPPRVQPFPREEDAVGVARGQQLALFLSERGEVQRVRDPVDGQAGARGDSHTVGVALVEGTGGGVAGGDRVPFRAAYRTAE